MLLTLRTRPVGAPLEVPLELAAERIGAILGETKHRHGCLIQESPVVDVHHKGWHISARRIDLSEGWQALFLELHRGPAANDLHPMRGRSAHRLLFQHLKG